MEDNNKKYDKYLDSLISSITKNSFGFINTYGSVKGCEAFARDFGYGLKSIGCLNKFQETYSFCVKIYNLTPPIDAKDWIRNVLYYK